MSSSLVESFREYIISRMNCYKMTKANLPVRAELANACEYLEELIENDGWISVDDDLPTNGSVCFVLREKIDVSKFPSYIPVPIHLMNSYYCRIDKTIYKDDHFTCDENSREKVTHWVLAPKEPQEQ